MLLLTLILGQNMYLKGAEGERVGGMLGIGTTEQLEYEEKTVSLCFFVG
jgi:hypothetical protein